MNQLLRASMRATAAIANLVPRGHSLVSGLEVYFAQVQGVGYVASMQEEVRAALRCIHSVAPVILDVGANRGEWTRNLLKRVSPQTRIYAFDPSPTNIRELQKITDNRVTVVPKALGCIEGAATLYTPFAGSGMGSLFDFRPPSSSPDAMLDREAVQVTTLDAFVKQQRITTIDFMKMDIEGNEFAALQGGMKSLKAGIIRALSFEFGQCNIASKTYLLDFWYLLNELSFNLCLIGPNGTLTPVREYSPRNEVLRHSNFVAIYKPDGVPATKYHR